MTRLACLTLGLVLVVGAGGAVALDVSSEPIVVWDDDEENFVTDVVYNPAHDEYLVLFANYRADSIDIYARRVAGDGTVLSWFAVVWGAGEEHLGARAAYCPSRDEYLVVWTRQQDTGTKDDILARTVFWHGGTMGPIFAVVDDADHQRNPDVAYNPTDDEYLVVYNNQWGGGLEDVAAQRVRASDGALLSWANIATGPTNNRHYPRVVYRGEENQYLIVYTLDQSGIYAKLAAANLSGVSVAPEIVVREDPAVFISWYLGLASGRGGYLVAWKEVSSTTSPSVRALRVSPTGVPDGPADGFLVSDYGLGAWQAYEGVSVSTGLHENFVLAWNADPFTFYDVDGAVVTQGYFTVATGPVIVADGTGNQMSPSLDCAAVGSCLVAYSDDHAHGTPTDDEVRARLFRPVIFSDRFETGDFAAWSTWIP